TRQELAARGWDALDIILVTGDAYIDSPFIGVSVIGHVLTELGYRVGVIAQPDIQSPDDIMRLGEPTLFWGVTGGSIDSMVANYTALKKPRRFDDYTPGGRNNRRPDRAVIVYTNLIKRYFKNTVPIVLGGIEASLRRVAHYDYWDNRVRRSILFDAKADYLLYGMAEKTVTDFADALRFRGDPRHVRGICYIASELQPGYIALPSFEAVASDKRAFIEMFHTFYRNNDPRSAKGLAQRHGNRYLIHNPPQPYLTQQELDRVYALDYERDAHPYYKKQGAIRALETITFAVPTHRGCYGECNFCAIAVHEGRTVRWRSPDAIVAEAETLTERPDFKGYIQDVSAPTANMYGFECEKKLRDGSCPDRRCLYPEICPALPVNHDHHLNLLQRIRALPDVEKVFVASGLRYDLILNDEAAGDRYIQELAAHHVSGQLKVAPEHSEQRVLDAMGKPGPESLLTFRKSFIEATREAGLPQFLTYYLIAAHPGCTERDMRRLRDFAVEELEVRPEQVQIFTPTPSTYASLMYYSEMDPFTGEQLFVEKDLGRKQRQKRIVTRGRKRR
ncbi:MAG: YgiQ family radical SAM protein, partial [Anaerolineae bacterium]